MDESAFRLSDHAREEAERRRIPLEVVLSVLQALRAR
jgi:hypothetical protein